MNDLLKDIETLTIVKNAVSKGVETEKVIETQDYLKR